MSCKTNAEDFCDVEFLAGFDVDKDFNDSETNQMFALFIIKAKEKSLAKKAKKKTSAIDAKKQVKLPDKIFNYIHTVRCQGSFPLDWYNDITYTLKKYGSI